MPSQRREPENRTVNLGLRLTLTAIPDPSTLSRRAETLSIPEPKSGKAPVHLPLDSTGLRLCSPGEWLVEQHGPKRRRAWRKRHINVGADTGQILAATLTTPDVDDAAQVGPLLDQVGRPITSFIGDGADDRDDVYDAVLERHPDAAAVAPPRSNAVPSMAAHTNPRQRDRQVSNRPQSSIHHPGRGHWRGEDCAITPVNGPTQINPPFHDSVDKILTMLNTQFQ